MAHLITENGKLIIRDDWHEEDIQGVAEDNHDTTLTHEQMLKVMELLVKVFDANIGIDWEVIDSAIEQILEEKVSL
tara:strand:- start:549 stop:776 length:228 start_codon:yes stop_codon:yes gene_type:complete